MFAATLLLSMMLPQAVASQRAVAAPAMQVRPVPDEAVRKQARLSANLTPAVRAKIAAASQALNQSQRVRPAGSAAQLQDATRNEMQRAFPSAQGADLDTLVFLVLSQAAQEQQADLQQQMSQMQQELAAKQKQRDSLNDMGEMQQMKLQSMEDQRSKMLEALSNMMKKASDTRSNITDNMK